MTKFREWDIDRGFNPHPVQRPDETMPGVPSLEPVPCFNPHPVRRPDETCKAAHRPTEPVSFNPHPVRRPDETSASPSAFSIASEFQSTSGPKTG